MPFRSDKERRYLFSQKPDVARKMVRDARRAGEPITMKSTPRRSPRKTSRK